MNDIDLQIQLPMTDEQVQQACREWAQKRISSPGHPVQGFRADVVSLRVHERCDAHDRPVGHTVTALVTLKADKP